MGGKVDEYSAESKVGCRILRCSMSGAEAVPK